MKTKEIKQRLFNMSLGFQLLTLRVLGLYDNFFVETDTYIGCKFDVNKIKYIAYYDKINDEFCIEKIEKEKQ